MCFHRGISSVGKQKTCSVAVVRVFIRRVSLGSHSPWTLCRTCPRWLTCTILSRCAWAERGLRYVCVRERGETHKTGRQIDTDWDRCSRPLPTVGVRTSLALYWPVLSWEKEASGAPACWPGVFCPNLGLLISSTTSAQGVPGPPLRTPVSAGSSLSDLLVFGHESVGRNVWLCCVFSYKM